MDPEPNAPELAPNDAEDCDTGAPKGVACDVAGVDDAPNSDEEPVGFAEVPNGVGLESVDAEAVAPEDCALADAGAPKGVACDVAGVDDALELLSSPLNEDFKSDGILSCILFIIVLTLSLLSLLLVSLPEKLSFGGLLSSLRLASILEKESILEELLTVPDNLFVLGVLF